MASSRLAELAGSDEAGCAARPHPGRRRDDPAGARGDRLHARCPRVQTDESTLMTRVRHRMVEAHDAKGSGWSIATRLEHFTDEAGVEAAQNAIDAMGGERVPSGDYTVVFGRQPVADLMQQPRSSPPATPSSFYASSHAVPGPARPARRLAALLSIYDHGAMPGLVGSQGHHLRGAAHRPHRPDPGRRARRAAWPTGTSTQRLLRDPALARQARRRPARRGGRARAAQRLPLRRRRRPRSSTATPGVAASNVVRRGRASRSSLEELLRAGRRRPLHRPHLVHLPDQRAARRVTSPVRWSAIPISSATAGSRRRSGPTRSGSTTTSPPFLNNVVGVTKDARGHDRVGGRRGRVRPRDRGVRRARGRDRRLHGGPATDGDGPQARVDRPRVPRADHPDAHPRGLRASRAARSR